MKSLGEVVSQLRSVQGRSRNRVDSLQLVASTDRAALFGPCLKKFQSNHHLALARGEWVAKELQDRLRRELPYSIVVSGPTQFMEADRRPDGTVMVSAMVSEAPDKGSSADWHEESPTKR